VLGLYVAAGGGIAPLNSAAFAAAHKCDAGSVWSALTF
jgi:hypothetical protein